MWWCHHDEQWRNHLVTNFLSLPLYLSSLFFFFFHCFIFCISLLCLFHVSDYSPSSTSLSYHLKETADLAPSNQLMLAFFSQGLVLRHPGPYTLRMLQTIGYSLGKTPMMTNDDVIEQTLLVGLDSDAVMMTSSRGWGHIYDVLVTQWRHQKTLSLRRLFLFSFGFLMTYLWLMMTSS